MYVQQLTYPIYDLNSTLFAEEIRNVLEVEFNSQITNHGKDFLPTVVKADGYLVNPINADSDLNPAFVAITRSNSDNDSGFQFKQTNLDNTYIIQIVAIGLDNLRKIADAIFIILNDMNVKHYFNKLKNSYGEEIIYNPDTYKIESITTDLQASKTNGNKDVVMGNLRLTASIAETVKFNETTPINSVVLTNEIGEDKIAITQTNTY